MPSPLSPRFLGNRRGVSNGHLPISNIRLPATAFHFALIVNYHPPLFIGESRFNYLEGNFRFIQATARQTFRARVSPPVYPLNVIL